MLKWILRIVVAVVILVIVLVVTLPFYVDRLAREALVGGVQYAGDVVCTIDDVNVSLLSGQVELKDLAIMNPKGYPEAEMLSLDSGDVAVQISSMWDGPVHVKKLEITKPLIRIEGGAGGTNISAFLANVNRKVGSTGGEEEPKEESEETRMWVDELVIKDATIRFGSGLSTGKVMDVPLASVELKDLRGKDDRGITSGELAATIVMELVRQGVLAGDLRLDDFIPVEVRTGLTETLKLPGTVLKGATDLIKSPLDTILKPPGKPKEEDK